MSTVRTHIEELDRLLGMTPLKAGNIVLIRGGPGTGKTTLALQIASRVLQCEKRSKVTLVSLETPSRDAIFHIGEYGFDLASYAGSRLLSVERQTVEEIVAESLKNKSRRGGLGSMLRRQLAEEWKKEARQRMTSPHVVIIDSLNVLASSVMDADPKRDLRSALQYICAALRPDFAWAVVILTGEYDPSGMDSRSVASESFFCDVEIRLQKEPVRAFPVDAIKTAEADGSRRTLPVPAEERLFCRVLKFRTGPNQHRRCAYDIVSGRGLVFYETYPGDGRIVLFRENTPQRAAWDEFFSRDIPEMYPSLTVDHFDRLGLQRTFASQRRFRYIPARTDMYLSSFDAYWVNWYVELCQRWDIAERMRKFLPCAMKSVPERRARFSRIVCAFHRRSCEALKRTPPALGIPACVDAIVGGVCVACPPRQRETCREPLLQALRESWARMSKEDGQSGLCQLIPWSDLRLFGERRSPLIEELDRAVPEENRPVFRPGFTPPRDSRNCSLLAVPYDANIGMMVYRPDKLDSLVEQLARAPDAGLDGGFADAIKNLYGEEDKWFVGLKSAIRICRKGTDLCEEDKAIVADFLNDFDEDKIVSPPSEEAQVDAAVQSLVEKLKINRFPQTWEEMYALCRMAEQNDRDPSNGKGLVLIETRTFDSYLCALLELVWNCGGRMQIAPDYTFIEKEQTLGRLFQAFGFVTRMFKEGIVPRDCSLEAQEMQDRFTAKAGQARSGEWLFARHWHSTLVDVLTEKDDRGEKPIWRPGSLTLGLMPMPVSLSRYIETRHEPPHISCWGEWYLAVMKGTENTKLAVDLINNLMSSQKICERAFRGACVPTVKEFYAMYGEDLRCLNIPERSPEIILPDMTFGGMRRMFFGSARSRSEVFDYRHCMREFHAVLQLVHYSATSVSAEVLATRLILAMARVTALSRKDLLLS